jgi:hypothetical protein
MELPAMRSTMTAMMIDDGKRVAAGGTRLQWHMISIADIDLIARNTGGKWGRVSTPKALIRSLPALSPSPLGFCDLCRGFPAPSIREQAI